MTTYLRGYIYAGYNAYAFNSGTISSSSVGLANLGFTDDQVRGSDVIMFTVEDNDIRWRIDGILDPDASTGHPAIAGSSFEVWGAGNIGRLLLIAVGSDAVVQISMGLLWRRY